MMEYHVRIHRALDFIESRLTESLNVSDVAREAFLSEPHLYKIFPIMTGCTVGQYIRRRRLSCSANELKNTQKRVIDIALDFQFESQESYIRAFKGAFGVTPGAYRKSSEMVIPLYKRLHLSPLQRKGGLLMQPEIMKKKFLLVGFEAKMDLSADFSEAMSALRDALRKNLPLIQHKIAPVRMVGIWFPDPDSQNEMSPKRVYFTGVEVAQISEIPEGCVLKDLPESLYAKFREESRGTMSRYAYTEWLPTSGYLMNMDLVPGDFEIFDDMEHDGVNDPCDILLPILPA